MEHPHSNVANHLNWLEARMQASSDERVWVEDPEEARETGYLSSSLGKTYLTYRIMLQRGLDITGARHRYSEFEAMRRDVTLRYGPLGVLVPSLPPKKPVSSAVYGATQSSVFVKERTNGLSLFCEAIIQNPFLASDVVWLDFMRAGDGGSSLERGGRDGGEFMLSALLDSVQPKYSLQQMMDRVIVIKDEVKLLEAGLKALVERFRHVQSCEKSLHEASRALSVGLDAFAAAEEMHVRSLRGYQLLGEQTKCVVPEKQAVNVCAREFSGLLLRNCAVSSEHPTFVAVLVVSALEQELSSLESLKELFKIHDEYLSHIEACKQKALFGKVADLEHNLGKFYKGFFFVTVPLAYKIRAINFKRALTAISACEVSRCHALAGNVCAFYDALNVSLGDVLESTARQVDLLALRPLEKEVGFAATDRTRRAEYRASLDELRAEVSGGVPAPTRSSGSSGAAVPAAAFHQMFAKQATVASSPQEARSATEEPTTTPPPPPQEPPQLPQEPPQATFAAPTVVRSSEKAQKLLGSLLGEEGARDSLWEE